jgi:hypothetical protein
MRRVQGVQGELELVQKCNKVFETFKTDIIGTAPDFNARKRSSHQIAPVAGDDDIMDLDDMSEHIERQVLLSRASFQSP